MAIPNSLNQRIGFRVMRARRYARLSALRLASQAGVHRNTVSRIESGDGASLEALWRITRVLNVTLDSLFEDQPQPIQLELFRYGRFEVSSHSNGRSDVLYALLPGVGRKRPRAAEMPATHAMQGLRNGTDAG